MAAILNSAILNLAILDLATLVFPLKLTHTCQDWFPPFAQKNLHSFILTQLDDGSHLEFYHVGFRHCHLGFRLLLIFSQIHSKTISLHYDSWLKLIQSDSNLFILTQLDDGSHLEFCHLEFGHLGFSHLSFSSQTHSHLPRLVPTICTIKPSLIHSDSTWWWQPSWILPCWIKKLHSFILTQLVDGSHLEFCHVGFRHLVFFSQIHSKTLSLHSDSWLKLIQSDSNLFILTQLDDGSHLEFGHLGFSHLSFSSQTRSHLPRLVPTICTKKPSLIHSDSTWWWQPYWILPSWIQPFCTHLWVKLIQSDSN